MFSNQLVAYAEKKFQERKQYLGGCVEQIEMGLETCSQEEAVLVKFFYGTMPLRDAGEYEFDVFQDYAKHAVWLREEVEWCKSLPEDVFVHYVSYYRINSEDISVCRPFFYKELKERIKGLTIQEAVLEINYWCAENATYETTDGRTASPMTVYRSGKGRCGEESTFGVAVFRSMGIPARQVYTPRWAHCDDNHAWVEVYLEGKWYFLGACEPEEVLNKGWFSNASSRALLVHSRVFSDFVGETKEECIGQEDLLLYYNNTSVYAKTKLFTIRVKDNQGKLVSGAEVSIEILNMAEFCSVATLVTDERGEVNITIGLGDIRVRVMSKQGGIVRFDEQLVSVEKEDCVELILAQSVQEEEWIGEGWTEITVEAPLDYAMNPVTLTRVQREKRRTRLAEANAMREERTTAHYDAKRAAVYPEETELLQSAKGNFEEVYGFLSKDENINRKKMLHTLTIKDYKDLKASVLEDHLVNERGTWEEEIYVENLLCPRIYLEELTPYRSFIRSYFTEEQKQMFSRNPIAIWRFVEAEIAYEPQLDYKTICATPIGCLSMKQGNLLSRKILFVAICRSIGIPARLNKVTIEAEYYDGKGFVEVSAQKEQDVESKGHVLLEVEDGSKWSYYQTWTIGKFHEDRFTTLGYEGIRFEGNSLTLELSEGTYRLITTSRMPNGNQHAAEQIFKLRAGEKRVIAMSLKEGNMDDLLLDNPISDFSVTNAEGVTKDMSTLLTAPWSVLGFLEEGAEPTEHVLNELMLACEEWNALSICTVFVVRDKKALENPTLQKTLAKIKAEVYFDAEGENAEPVARRMYVDPEKLPLLTVIKEGMKGIYACSGYNVGSVDLMMKIVKR